tara:strand:+ start:1052 stop:2134 length:1083 start_codon:yes stop_codon:yes gene_type:complete
LKNLEFKHGGNINYFAEKFNLSLADIIDASASIVPFSIPNFLKDELCIQIKNESFRYYPERNLNKLKEKIGSFHNIDPSCIMPGNGASEIITWVGCEASNYQLNCLPVPGFVDYERALNCWKAKYFCEELPKNNLKKTKQSFPIKPICDVIWITNPHNPTGQLWDRKSLEELIDNYELVICDEAFLSLTPNGENESLIPLTKKFDNLIVIRSLTKLFSIPGLRLGYMVSSSKLCQNLNNLRDPWPVNSLAIQAGIKLLSSAEEYKQLIMKVHKWIDIEKQWLTDELKKISKIKVHASSTNFFLIESQQSLIECINYLIRKKILIRECSSFRFLDNKWARISLQTHEKNKMIAVAFHKFFL